MLRDQDRLLALFEFGKEFGRLTLEGCDKFGAHVSDTRVSPRSDQVRSNYNIHVSIARTTPACIAPIGQAWDLALARHPELSLYATDGNHSSPAGAFLTALVLLATITGASPLDMPPLAESGVDEATQPLLRAVAADTVRDWPPRAWCPDDPY